MTRNDLRPWLRKWPNPVVAALYVCIFPAALLYVAVEAVWKEASVFCNDVQVLWSMK